MEKTLITGAGGFIGSYLAFKFPDAKCINHAECDLTKWDDVVKNEWEGDVIINCANVGNYGMDLPGNLEKNLVLLGNLRRRWPNAKIISFGSGAMYDKSKPIVKVGEYDKSPYPSDLYGLSKRLTVDMSDVTLIIFGLFGKTRFVKSVLDHVEKKEPSIIFQDVLFSWVNLADLPGVIEWVVKNGQGRYNLCGFDMLLSDVAKFLGSNDIIYQKPGLAYEYTGKPNKIKLSTCPVF
jgi:nucleoside-diphosphate-sugar epimerase